MAAPTTLQSSWTKGMAQDFPRNQMPKGYAWNLIDYLPMLGGASIDQRGGWTAAGDVGAVTATASQIIGGIYPPTWGFNVAIDEDGRVYKVTTAGVVTDVASGLVVAQNPVIHRDNVIVPDGNAAVAPNKITNSSGTLTVASLGGSPPIAKYATVFNDYSVLAHTSAQPQRLFFSDPGDPETWDTTNSTWDVSQPITGLVALRTALLIFHDSYISRIRGTTPPLAASGSGGDFIADDPLFAVGTSDARSIAVKGDRILFANGEGVFMTDGSAEPADLTRLCGMTNYWQSLLDGYDASSWTLVGGFLQGGYVICVMDGATFKDCAFINLNPLSWWRLSNVDAKSMWAAQGTTDQLYFGRRGAAKIGELSSMFMPSSTVKNDGNSTAVASTFESAYYEGEFGAKSIKRVYIDHELTDYSTDNPTATVGYITTPEDTSYTSLSGTISESTTKTTYQSPLNLWADGIAFKITRTNAGHFKLYGIEAEVEAAEKSRRAA